MSKLLAFTERVKSERKSVLQQRMVHIVRCFWEPVCVAQIAHFQILDILCRFREFTSWKSIKPKFDRYSMPLGQAITAVLQYIGSGSNDDLKTLLAVEFSWFIEMIVALGVRGKEYWDEIHSNRFSDDNASIDDMKVSDEDRARFADYTKSGASYSRPLLRYRMRYNIDTQRSVHERSLCNKDYVRKTKQYSYFARYYCPHGVSLGHHISQNAESVLDINQGIMSTMERAPRYFIYDNICKAGDAARVREPIYWNNTTFLGDELHSSGHVCGYFYNSRDYKYGGGVGIHGINDTVVEQANARLKSIRLAATFMSLDLLMTMANAIVELQRRESYQQYYKFNPIKDLFKDQ